MGCLDRNKIAGNLVYYRMTKLLGLTLLITSISWPLQADDGIAPQRPTEEDHQWRDREPLNREHPDRDGDAEDFRRNCQCPSFQVFMGKLQDWQPEVHTLEVAQNWHSMYFTFARDPVFLQGENPVPRSSLAKNDLLIVVYFNNSDVICIERLTTPPPDNPYSWVGVNNPYVGPCRDFAWNQCGGRASVEQPAGDCVPSAPIRERDARRKNL